MRTCRRSVRLPPFIGGGLENGSAVKDRRCTIIHASSRGWRAFTLLEVILALVILGAALAIFGEVMQLANRNAADARAETQAQLLASSLMDEILAGVVADSPANRQPLESTDDMRWVYSISTGQATIGGVYPLEVIVEQDLEPRFNPVKFRLVRWLPTTAEDSENEEEEETDSQRESSDGRSGNRSGGAGGAGTAGGAAGAGGTSGAGGTQR